jgi:hypothetical protein
MRNEAATPGDLFANAVHKKLRALHHAAAQDNPVGSKGVDQVCEAETEVVTLAINDLRASSSPSRASWQICLAVR